MPAQPARTVTQRRSEGANRSRARRAEKPASIPRVSRVVPADSSGEHFQGGQRRAARTQRSGGSGGGGGGSDVIQPTQQYQQTKRSLGEVSSATPKLAAEWLICVLIITATQLTKDDEYLSNMSEVLWRVTATTGVFFVLAIASMAKQLTGITVAFGFLIVLVVLYKNTDEIKTVFDVASGKGSGQTADQLDSAIDPGASKNVGHEFVQ